MTPRNPWRRTRRRELTTIAALTVSIIVTFALLCAGLAYSMPETPQQDGHFLITLGEHGIGYGDASQVLTAGHSVCDLLDAGGSIELVIDTLTRTTQLGRQGSMVFAAISIAAFCGWHGDAARPNPGGGTRVLGVIA